MFLALYSLEFYIEICVNLGCGDVVSICQAAIIICLLFDTSYIPTITPLLYYLF